ncbi:MAG: hypothetical protein RLZ10_1860 [Bacteroidota bacterium]|jgi:hypothetical protein
MSVEWYYSKDGKRKGPISYPELKKLVENNHLQPNDLVWHEGLPEWVIAKKIKGLYEGGAEKSESSKAPGQNNENDPFLSTARKLGSIAANIFVPDSFDDLQDFNYGGDKPGIFMNDDFFGGRTKIGVSVKTINNTGSWIGVALFSWFYLYSFLRTLGNAWEFIPFSRSEYVLIKLEQKVMWRRVFPLFMVWCLIICASYLVISFAGAVILKESGSSVLAFMFFLALLGVYVISNLFVLSGLIKISTNGLLRTSITFDYGFPKKYRLLQGLSDAPLDKQLDGVNKLCEAISKAKFSQWDQFSTHENSSSNSLVGATLGKIRGLYSSSS